MLGVTEKIAPAKVFDPDLIQYLGPDFNRFRIQALETQLKSAKNLSLIPHKSLLRSGLTFSFGSESENIAPADENTTFRQK